MVVGLEKLNTGPWIDRPFFTLFMCFVILLNIFLIGVEIDTLSKDSTMGEKILWTSTEMLFCIIFVLELGFRIHYHPRKWAWVVENGWNACDTAIVVLAVVDIVVALVDLILDMGDAGMDVVSILKIFRLFRLMRIIRVLRSYRKLAMVVGTLVEALKLLRWVAVLAVLFIYTFAVFFTVYIGQRDDLYVVYAKATGGWEHDEFFGTVPKSMFSLFQIMMLEGWASKVVRHVMSNQPFMIVVFVLFIMLSSFGMLNLVVGVIVQHVLMSGQSFEADVIEAEEKDTSRVLERLREVLMGAEDCSADRTMTQYDFEQVAEEPSMAQLLEAVNLSTLTADMLFTVLDEEGSGTVPIDVFLGGCRRLKGPARSKDLLTLGLAAERMANYVDQLEVVVGEGEEKLVQVDRLTFKLIMRLGMSDADVDAPFDSFNDLPDLDAEEALAQHPARPNQTPSRMSYLRPGPGAQGSKVAPRQTLKALAEEVKKEKLSLGNRPDLPQLPVFMR